MGIREIGDCGEQVRQINLPLRTLVLSDIRRLYPQATEAALHCYLADRLLRLNWCSRYMAHHLGQSQRITMVNFSELSIVGYPYKAEECH